MGALKGTKPKKTRSPSKPVQSTEISDATEKVPLRAQRRQEKTVERAEIDFPIAGIGASAGGLEALEELFDNMPTDTGIAFVVVTHQHPGHTSMLPELLRRKTEMPVLEAAEGTRLEPNHVYVGPPGGQITILEGTLHRMEVERNEAPRL